MSEWLEKKDELSMFNIDGYKLYNCNRQVKKGGGVLLYVAKLFENNLVSELMLMKILKLLLLKFSQMKRKIKKVTVAYMYRAPNTNFENFNKRFVNICILLKIELFICVAT